ncbi:hypothetical protein VPH35_016884 [Triticum aestivum]|uniref:Knottins-like domain-containing protein n=1 Tax=Triticum aestivum TaxID=4565 RepID=A0A3B6A260_WHEAT
MMGFSPNLSVVVLILLLVATGGSNIMNNPSKYMPLEFVHKYTDENREAVHVATPRECVEKQGLAQEDIPPVVCYTPSKDFKGQCVIGVIESNCISVCKAEGFMGGKCVGVCKRCYCTNLC